MNVYTTPKADAQARIAKYTAQVRAARAALDAAKADLEYYADLEYDEQSEREVKGAGVHGR